MGPTYWPSPGGRKQGRRQSAPPQPASPQEGGGGGGVEDRGPGPREEAQCWPRPLMPSVLPSRRLPGPARNARAVSSTCSAPPGRCSAAGSVEQRWDRQRCTDPAPAAAVRFETAEGGGTRGHAPSKSRPLSASPAVGSPTQSFRPAQSRSLITASWKTQPARVPSLGRSLGGVWMVPRRDLGFETPLAQPLAPPTGRLKRKPPLETVVSETSFPIRKKGTIMLASQGRRENTHCLA